MRRVRSLVLITLLSLEGRRAAAQLPPATVTTTAAVKQLSPQQLSVKPPARIRGIVSYYDPEWTMLFVQDQTGGVYVRGDQRVTGIAVGDEVEVEGVAAAGGYTPVVDLNTLTRLGRAVLPAPDETTIRDLWTGRHDADWVKTRGLVLATNGSPDHWSLEVAAGGARLTVYGMGTLAAVGTNALFSEVELTGVNSLKNNDRRELTDVTLFVPVGQPIRTLRAADQVLDAAPHVTPAQLHAATDQDGEAVRLRGVITYRAGQLFCVQEGGSGVFVNAVTPAAVPVGTVVWVTGMARLRNGEMTVEGQRVDAAGPGPAITPFPWTRGALADRGARGRLVTVEGEFLHETVSAIGRVLVLRGPDGTLETELERTNFPEAAAKLTGGERVAVTGVLSFRDQLGGLSRHPRLLARQPADLRVLSAAPWPLKRTLELVSGLSLALLGGLVALVLANRRLRRSETDLARARDTLERRVDERTQDLAGSNRELLHKEGRLRAIFEATPDCIAVLDREGRLLEINVAGREMLELQQLEPWLGKVCLPLIAPEFREAFVAFNREVCGGREARLEFAVITARNRRRLLDSRGAPLKTPEGGTLNLSVTRDVTEVRAAQQALRTSEAELAEAQRLANLGSWTLDLVTDRVTWSDQECRLHGVPPGTTLQREEFDATVHPGDRERVLARLQQELAAGAAQFSEELRIIRADGAVRHLFRRASIQRSADGTPVRILGTSLDVTERKEAEAQVQAVQAKLAAIIDSATDAIIALDAGHRIALFNPAAERIFGWPAAEVIGRPLGRLIPERFRHTDGEHIAGFAAAGTSQRVMGQSSSVFGLRADGTEFPAEASIAKAQVGGEGILTVILRDVTERYRAEETRRKLETQLFQSQKMEAIGTLAGGIAHDFNNILGVIIGFLGLVRMDVADRSGVLENLDEIGRAAERARDLVRQILTFSRQEDQSRSVISPETTIREAQKLLRAALPATAELAVELAGNAPHILAHTTQLHQVLMNLVVNAADALEGHKGRIVIRYAGCEVDAALAATQPGLHAGAYGLLTVRDNGKGMDATTVARVFEPFFTTKGPGRGTGLGLAVVHGIMSQLGGVILVESAPGKGTEFRLYFPAQVSDLPTAAADAQPWRRGAGEHILLVDDEPALVSVGRHLLERAGYRVTSHTSAREALEDFRTDPQRFAVLVFDLTMPGLTGPDLAAECWKLRPDVPIILATGFAGGLTEEQAHALGFRHLLHKPVTQETLCRAVADVLTAAAALAVTAG